MVQQLSLSSSLPPSHLPTLRITLEALTGMKPEPLSRHTVIMKPRFPFSPEPVPGKVNQTESYRIRMVRAWLTGSPEAEPGQTPVPVTASVEGLVAESISGAILKVNDAETTTIKDSPSISPPITLSRSAASASIWTIQLSDIPAGGNRPVSIQNIYEATVYKTDDLLGYMDELGYMAETEYWIKGYRFYYNEVIIEVFRLYVRHGDGVGLLDRSGRYQVKCYVNVCKLNDLDSVSRGVKELEGLKKEVGGLIELGVPERTEMDSRVNSRIAGSTAPSVSR